MYLVYRILSEYFINIPANDDPPKKGQPNELNDRQVTLTALCGIDKTNNNPQNNNNGISLEDYYKIFSVLTHIDDVDKVF